MGLNLGENAKSAIITRSFVEINRFGESLGANRKTIFGLSGLGDLILTCNSLKSRNTKFGYLISTTNTSNFKEILKSQEITEGFFTVAAVYKMAKQKKIYLLQRLTFENVHKGPCPHARKLASFVTLSLFQCL